MAATATEITVNSMEAYYKAAAPRDGFRVTTYITAETAFNKEKLMVQAGSLDVITDVIFFGSTRFDEKGNLYFSDAELDGRKVDGSELFQTSLKNIQEAIGDRNINLYCNFIGPDAPAGGSAKDKGRLHNEAMGDNKDTLMKNLIEFTQTNQFEGIFFDYEYPRSRKDWKTYGQFLKELKEKTTGICLLGAATPAWKNLWAKQAVEPLDMAEVMGYDTFDDQGFHASFSTTARDLAAIYLNMKIDTKKVDLGMPFYARPVDGASLWYDYAMEGEALGKTRNIATGSIEGIEWTADGGVLKTRDITRYYNGYQMIYDKTAYAIDAGLGGVMSWHYGYDLPYENELSLFRAMQQAIDDRTTA